MVFGGLDVGSSGVIALSSLDGANGFKLNGENDGDESGFSVRAAGDINGDGHGDLIIGAPFYSEADGSFSAGRSYVVFGGPGVGNSGTIALSSLDGANGFKLDGENQYEGSGSSVSGAGDINGDGYPDLIIGAPHFGEGGEGSKGRSYVVFGGPPVNGSMTTPSPTPTTPSPTSTPTNSTNSTNSTITPTPTLTNTSNSTITLTPTPTNTSHSTITPTPTPTHISTSTKKPTPKPTSKPTSKPTTKKPTPAPTASTKSRFPAVMQLSALNGQNGFKLDGENNGDFSGHSVSMAGDINGDGHADLIIGAFGYPGGNHTGRSYVLFGGPGVGHQGVIALSTLNGATGFKLDGEFSGDNDGVSVSVAGDVNGDGHADLLIGAGGYAHYQGRSYVVFGGPGVGHSGVIALSSLNGTSGFTLTGEFEGDHSGHSVSTAGDINGDGYVDLIIGAYGYSGGKGRSYVVFGGSNVGRTGSIALSSLNGSTGFKLDGELMGDLSGFSVSTAGDVNGDGHADLFIGAPGYSGGRGKGRGYVVFGGPGVGHGGILSLSSLNGATGFKLNGELVGDYNSWSISMIGDVNDDGHTDLLIGAYGYLGGNNTGRSYVLFGGPGVGSAGVFNLSSLNGATGFKLDGELLGDQSGWSVSAAGDINGDGHADLLIGAPDHSGGATGKGRSYVVFGGPPVSEPTTTSFSIPSKTSTGSPSSTPRVIVVPIQKPKPVIGGKTPVKGGAPPKPNKPVAGGKTPVKGGISPKPNKPMAYAQANHLLGLPRQSPESMALTVTPTPYPLRLQAELSEMTISESEQDFSKSASLHSSSEMEAEAESKKETILADADELSPVTSSASRSVGEPWIGWMSRLPISLAVAGMNYLSAGISRITSTLISMSVQITAASFIPAELSLSLQSKPSNLSSPETASSLLDSTVAASQLLVSCPAQHALMLLQIPAAKLGQYRDRERLLTAVENQALQEHHQKLLDLQRQLEPHQTAVAKADPEFAWESQHLIKTLQSELIPTIRSGKGSSLLLERVERLMGYLEKRAETIAAWASTKSREDKPGIKPEADGSDEWFAGRLTPGPESQVSRLTSGIGLWRAARPTAVMGSKPVAQHNSSLALR